MKKIIMYSLFTLSPSFLVLSQGSWTSRASLPDSGRDLGISFSIGNYGYVGLGGYIDLGPEYLNDFWQFDPSTNMWTRKADFPGNARIAPATFVIGNYAYVVSGGEINSTRYFVNEVWQYNSLTDTWTQKHNFPGLSRTCAAGFSIGNKGYIGTGYDTVHPLCKDMWEYDTASDTWTQKNDFGGIPRYGASSFVVDGKGYVCFGEDSSHPDFIGANDMWAYDTGADTWTQKSSNPIDSLGFASGFVIGNSIYVGTGQQFPNYNFFDEFWQYNTATDTWAQQTSYPGPSIGACSSFAIGDTGYMGLGLDSSATFLNLWNKFEPDSITTIENILLPPNIDVLVSPNPFCEYCIISGLTENNNSKLLFSLYDIQGREIKMNIKKSGNNYIIYRDGLQQGTYILSIGFNNQIIHRKLVMTD